MFIPLFIITVAGLLKGWKQERNALFASAGMDRGATENWTTKVVSYSFSYLVILIVCVVIVFAVQWSGVYLLPLLRGDIDGSMVDWILVAIVRPDVLATTEAVSLSALANLYSAFVYWCYFCGLLLLYTIVHDFHEMCGAPVPHPGITERHRIVGLGIHLMRGVFRCAIFGILSATCIKLNAVYLITDAENIVSWMTNDALAALGRRSAEWRWLAQSPTAFMTSFFVLFIGCFIFFICLAQVWQVVEQMSKGNSHSMDDRRIDIDLRPVKEAWARMVGVVVLLSANFLLIGQFTGFSLLFFGAVLIAIYSVALPKSAS